LESQLKKVKSALKNSQALQEQNSKLLKEKLDKAKYNLFSSIVYVEKERNGTW